MQLNLRYNALTENERKEFPTISVAGQVCIIPPLAPRQNRRIIPRMSRIGVIDFMKLDEAAIDDLYMIIYWALTRAYDIDESTFMDLNIPLTEIMPAIVVITEQTGLASLAKPGEAKLGEETATGTTLQTGTSSSPEPAPQLDGNGTT